MLELILTRPFERKLVRTAKDLRFLVLDELHTYRGRQGADVALLVRRVREATEATDLQCVGTSATLAGQGTLDEQQAEVARVASLLFGDEVRPENVIGETLRRATRTVAEPSALRQRVGDSEKPPAQHDAFVADPLASWLETTLGLAEEAGSRRLVRAEPKPITGVDGIAADLAGLTDLPEDTCLEAVRETLLAGYDIDDPETGFPAFAFRVHQFFSRRETVYASLEPEGERHITTQLQQYVPGSREKLLFPLAFCYECGQEYYTVRQEPDPDTGSRVFSPRDLLDVFTDEHTKVAFLYSSSDHPWPEDPAEQLDRLPDDWTEIANGTERIKRSFREYLPVAALLGPDGHDASEGLACHVVPAPFRFCLRCGVSHAGRRPRDFGKLLTLGAGGRSSATTILSLAAIRSLRADETLDEKARKLLSFSDNRQDASLQAGHFNDFVEVGLLRSALFRAADRASAGLAHDELTMAVFNALDLPLELYGIDSTVRFAALDETNRALRDVLGYRLYRDLERGWRITAPNLEQCGLLEIDYVSLDELASAEDVWQDEHTALSTARPAERAHAAKTLLDFMRRELCVKVDYLDQAWQEGLRQRAGQRLRDPWGIDENEELEHAAVLYPRPRRRAAQEYRGNVFISARGGYGQFLRRVTTFPSHGQRLTLDDQHPGRSASSSRTPTTRSVLYPNGIVSPGRQFGTALCSVGSSAGVPSALSSRNRNPAIRSNTLDTLRGYQLREERSMDEPTTTHGAHGGGSLNRAAFSATTHCLTGCAIGEVLGMILATWWGWGNAASIALAIVLAFFFGYSLTIGPVLRAGVPLRRALPLAFASDTASITVMEIVDNAFILIVPGAIAAGLGDALFWWSLGVSLVIAFAFALPLNRWLIARGKGHAVVHAYHAH
jgi:Domain of unknown function (DUF4396)